MSEPEFDNEDPDTESMFDFLSGEGEQKRGQMNETKASRAAARRQHPIIRKPVPISESGPLLPPRRGAPVEPPPQLTVSQVSPDDDDLSFLEKPQTESVHPSSANSSAYDQNNVTQLRNPAMRGGSETVSSDNEFDELRLDNDDGLSFHNDWRAGHSVSQELQDNENRGGLRWAAYLVAILFIGAGVASFLFADQLGITNSFDVQRDKDQATQAITEQGVDTVDPTQAASDVQPSSMLAQFETQLAALESLVRAGSLDEAEQTLVSMDRTLYGYGAPEFAELESRIAGIRAGEILPEQAGNDKAAEADRARLELEQQAESEAARLEQARVAEQAAQAEAARLEQARVAQLAAQAEAERLEQARVAEQAAQAEAERLEQARVAEQAAQAEAERLEQARVAEQAAQAEAERLEQARVAELAAQAEAERLEQAKIAQQAAQAEAERLEQANIAEQAAQAEAERLEQANIAQQAAQAEAERLEQARAAQLAAQAEAERLEQARAAEQARAQEQNALSDAAREEQARVAQQAALTAATRLERAQAQELADANRNDADRRATDRRIAEERAAIQRQEARDLRLRQARDRELALERLESDDAASSQQTATRSVQNTDNAAGTAAPEANTVALANQNISDDDLQLVYRRFANLQKAVRDRDINAVISLTQRSGIRVQQLMQMFENSVDIDARIRNVSTSNASGEIKGTLEIKKIKRADGSVSEPPASLAKIRLSSQREPAGWSAIRW